MRCGIEFNWKSYRVPNGLALGETHEGAHTLPSHANLLFLLAACRGFAATAATTVDSHGQCNERIHEAALLSDGRRSPSHGRRHPAAATAAGGGVGGQKSGTELGSRGEVGHHHGGLPAGGSVPGFHEKACGGRSEVARGLRRSVEGKLSQELGCGGGNIMSYRNDS